MMTHVRLVALLIVASTFVDSQTTEFDVYAGGYIPTTLITDYAAIDLDQVIINEQTLNKSLLNAWYVYTEGGHSGSYSELQVTNSSHNVSHMVGDVVIGKNPFAEEINGTLLEDAIWDINGSGVLKVKYFVGPDQLLYSECTVGGLRASAAGNRQGCFVENGVVTVVENTGLKVDHEYAYNSRLATKNLITIQKFKFGLFVDYYGDYNYGDKWITAAYTKVDTNFSSTRGNSDFSTLQNRDGQGSAMKVGSAYLIIWMEVVRYLNDAVVKCQNGNLDATASLDKAVAYYSGGLTTEPNDDGVLLFALAEIRAHQMKTDGYTNKTVSDSFVNGFILNELNIMQKNLLSDDVAVCIEVEKSKERIVTMMQVPLIQSIIQYAYIQANELSIEDESRDQIVAEGATFTATMLPLIFNCNNIAAEIIHNNMKINATTSFDDVKNAIESQYICLGVTCEDIGGVWNHDTQQYKSLPCNFTTNNTSTASPRLVGAWIIVAIIVVLLACVS